MKGGSWCEYNEVFSHLENSRQISGRVENKLIRESVCQTSKRKREREREREREGVS
jgi:hypothetical protein